MNNLKKMRLGQKSIIVKGNENEVVKVVSELQPGTIHSFLLVGEVKLAKKYGDTKLLKVTKMQGRIGEYANQQRVIEKRANEPEGTEHKPAYEMQEVIENRVYVTPTGKTVIRLLPVHNDNHMSLWLENGKIVPLDELKERYAPSILGLNKKEAPDCISVSASKIFAIC